MKEDRARIFLNNDNDEGRELVDFCIKQRKTVVNPIIDWEDEDVWEFIHEYSVPYCSLYDEGFTRLGCIGCPLAGSKRQKIDFERWPKYKEAYIKAFQRMIDRNREAYEHGNYNDWKTGEDVMRWWLKEKEGIR